MQYVGDFTKGSEVFLTFDPAAKAGGSIGATSPVGSGRVFMNGDAGSYDTAGVGSSPNFSGSTGIHRIDIDTSGAFYARAAEYVVLLVGATVDTALVFSIAFSGGLSWIDPATDVAWANEMIPLLGYGAMAPLWVSLAVADWAVKLTLALAALVPFRMLTARTA